MQPYRSRPGEESRLGDPHTPALSPGFQDYPPSDPATSTAPVPLSRGIATSGTHATPPSLTRMMTTTTMIGSGVDGHGHSHSQSHTNNPSGLTLSSPNLGSSQASTPVPTGTSEHIQSLGVRTPASALLRSATTSHRNTPGTALAPTSAETPVSHVSGASHQDKQVISASAQKSAKDAAGAAAKSFRVTLEDPCFKVLPAALKKYNINDDWRMYAMFICYGDTGESNRTSDNRSDLRLILASFRFNVIERCLSYDEMPLLLFQKLKESGQKPVFMLRHIVSSCTKIARLELVAEQIGRVSRKTSDHLQRSRRASKPPAKENPLRTVGQMPLTIPVDPARVRPPQPSLPDRTLVSIVLPFSSPSPPKPRPLGREATQSEVERRRQEVQVMELFQICRVPV
jgi:hypothetical protein